MERRKAERIDGLVDRFLRMEGLETPLKETKIINSWTDVAGDRVAMNTEKVYIYNQILYVKLKSPSLRANLQMKREELLHKLNAIVREKIIIDIKFC